MPGLGVYIHVPWCRRRCPYCDFPIAVATGEIPHRQYADAVIRELDSRANEWRGAELDTIYVGGGTPSLWDPSQLARVLAAISERIPGRPREVTLEANPADCIDSRMRAWMDAGVDRLSIGVQSFADSELVTLGRDHRMGGGLAALERALGAEFRSLTADFILSVPGGARDPGALRAAELGVPHLSTYELTVEVGTPLAAAVRRGELAALSDDECAERYLAMHRELTKRGYQHYEVSSYALPGHRAVHNSRYWRCEPYLGLGNGASSLELLSGGAARRRGNPRSVGRYLADPTEPAGIDEVSADEMRRDQIWLGLRTVDGVPADVVPAEVSAWLLEGDLAEAASGCIRPTIRGFLYHDAIARRVVTSLG